MKCASYSNIFSLGQSSSISTVWNKKVNSSVNMWQTTAFNLLTLVSDHPQPNVIYCRKMLLVPEWAFALEHTTTCCEMKQAAKLNSLSFALVAIPLIYCFSLMLSWGWKRQQTLKNVHMQWKVHKTTSRETTWSTISNSTNEKWNLIIRLQSGQ